MHRKGHVGAALAAYAPIGGLLVAAGIDALAVAGGMVAFGLATLPDLDRRIPFVDHRGVTHTVHFAGAVGGLVGTAGALSGRSAGIGTAVALGGFGFLVGSVTVLSHVAADALTPMGVDPFRTGRRRSLDVVRAANPIANDALLALGVVSVGVAYVVGAAIAGSMPG